MATKDPVMRLTTSQLAGQWIVGLEIHLSSYPVVEALPMATAAAA